MCQSRNTSNNSTRPVPAASTPRLRYGKHTMLAQFTARQHPRIGEEEALQELAYRDFIRHHELELPSFGKRR